ncbi:MAG: hypothetical protein HUU54_13530 [Ignavibacteriaceae bacterium]|nr:hypothetical protein [Ignavibacteriaceae bacterium]
MKNIFALFCAFLISTNLFAQDEKPRTFFDAPFGGGGGFVPAWFIPNVDDINTKLVGFGTEELSTSGFFASGGAGFAYIGVIPNLRIGGIGMSGTMKATGIKDGTEREIIYSNSFGGFTAEYTLPFIKSFGVSIGAILGGGELSLMVSRNKGSYQWNEIWTEISDTSLHASSFTRSFRQDYFTIAPTLNIDIPLYRFLAVRIGAGYAFAFGSDWKVDNEKEIFNVPDSFNGNNLFIQAGVMFGFFAY